MRVFTAAAVAATLLSAAVACRAKPPARDVTLVARGMIFVLDGEEGEDAGAPNPVVRLRAGERVRLVLRNEAQGLLHDVEIPAWKIAVPEIRAGETAAVTFTVPDTPGEYEYRCRPHAEMMRGIVSVVP